MRCIFLQPSDVKNKELGKLVKTIQNAFPWSIDDEVSGNYDKCWSEMYEKTFDHENPVDYTMEILHSRLKMIESSSSSSIFDENEALEQWRMEERENVENLLESVIDQRSDNPCTALTKVCLDTVTIFRDSLGDIKKSEWDILSKLAKISSESSIDVVYNLESEKNYYSSEAKELPLKGDSFIGIFGISFEQ